MHFVGHIFPRQLGQRLGRRDLHRVVDRACSDVQGAAKYIWKPKNIVDLIGIITASGCDDRVRADSARFLGRDFGVRIGHGEDDRLVGHRRDHFLRQRALHGQPKKHIGAHHSLGERAGLRVCRVGRLPLIHAFGAALINHALCIAEDHMLRSNPHSLE